MIFQPIYEDAWALEDMVFFAFIIILLLGFIFPLGPASQRRIKKAERDMDSYNITIRRLPSVWWCGVSSLLIPAWIYAFMNSADTTTVFATNMVLLGAIISRILRAASHMFWRVEVRGNEIRMRTLFMRREFSFRDIKQIRAGRSLELKMTGIGAVFGIYRVGEGHVSHVTVYSETKELFSIPPGVVGYELFMNRLKAWDTDGVREVERELEKDAARVDATVRKLDETSRKYLGAVKSILPLLALMILTVGSGLFAIFSDYLLLTDAHTALDVIRGYYAMYLAIQFYLIAAVFFVLITVRIVRSRKRSGRLAWYHAGVAVIIFAFAGVSAAGLIVEERIPAMFIQASQDIAAIENGQLVTADYQIHLTWEDYYRLASLRDFGEYEPLYVVRAETIGRIYFPRELSPDVLKGMAAGEEYQLPDAVQGTRQFVIKYTPNLHIVVDAIPYGAD